MCLCAVQFSMFGHSAGAQFVHRYITYMPQGHLRAAVAANAGWYTLLDQAVKLPYGLFYTGTNKKSVKQTLARPLTVLLGTADTDTKHKHLRNTAEAKQQVV